MSNSIYAVLTYLAIVVYLFCAGNNFVTLLSSKRSLAHLAAVVAHHDEGRHQRGRLLGVGPGGGLENAAYLYDQRTAYSVDAHLDLVLTPFNILLPSLRDL